MKWDHSALSLRKNFSGLPFEIVSQHSINSDSLSWQRQQHLGAMKLIWWLLCMVLRGIGHSCPLGISASPCAVLASQELEPCNPLPWSCSPRFSIDTLFIFSWALQNQFKFSLSYLLQQRDFQLLFLKEGYISSLCGTHDNSSRLWKSLLNLPL